MKPNIHYQYQVFRTSNADALAEKLDYMSCNFWRVHTFWVQDYSTYCVLFERDLGLVDEWPVKT